MIEFLIPVRSRLRGVEPIDPSAPLAVQAASTATGPAPRVLAQARMQEQALAQVVAQLADATCALQADYRQRLFELERAAVTLGVAIAARLVHQKLASGDFAVESLVHRAIEQLDVKEPVTVFLHPEDQVLLERRLGGQALALPAGASVRFAGDASLGRGGCRAEAAELRVLSRLDEQLEAIREHLMARIADEPPDTVSP